MSEREMQEKIDQLVRDLTRVTEERDAANANARTWFGPNGPEDMEPEEVLRRRWVAAGDMARAHLTLTNQGISTSSGDLSMRIGWLANDRASARAECARLREEGAAAEALIMEISTDLAQDALEDPVGHAEREAHGRHQIGKGVVDALRAHLRPPPPAACAALYGGIPALPSALRPSASPGVTTNGPVNDPANRGAPSPQEDDLCTGGCGLDAVESAADIAHDERVGRSLAPSPKEDAPRCEACGGLGLRATIRFPGSKSCPDSKEGGRHE